MSDKNILQNKGEIKTLTDGSHNNSLPRDLHYKKIVKENLAGKENNIR